MTAHSCQPAKCGNGKCRATGECIEVARPSAQQCCNKTVLMRCPDCPHGPKMRTLPNPEIAPGVVDCLLRMAPEVESPPLAPQLSSGMGHAYSFALDAMCRALDTPRTIVAFTGLAGSGKSTAAAHLVRRHGYQRVRFAGPLKAMMMALGCTPAEIDGARKEMPCELLGGKTPRHAMQTLGTEWGRDLIASDLWIRAWQAAVAKVPAGVPIVVDDCRFPNEGEAVRAAGGVIVRIDRPGAGTASVHASEQHVLPAVETLRNIADERYLLDQVDILVTDLGWLDRQFVTNAVT